MPLEVIYHHPKLIRAEGTQQPAHRLELWQNDSFMGLANLVYKGRPISHYYLSCVSVPPDRRGMKIGGTLMDAVNDFLDQRKMPGLLKDVTPQGSKAHGFYANHGWEPLPDLPNWYCYGDELQREREKLVQTVVSTLVHIRRSFLRYHPTI